MKRGINKQGVEISTNAIIIFVLAALALAVLAYFFLSGTGKTTGTIADIFRTSTAGVTRSLAIETCQQRCDQMQELTATQIKKSAYCTKSFYIDDDGDGQADTDDSGKKIPYYCEKDLGTSCLVKGQPVTCEPIPQF
ncbi:MAG: hypothetical protein Q7R96_03395 [Nanoarchaeota archaeon]|nr:hypothetical protein [Nanoarchaeota archaeon]